MRMTEILLHLASDWFFSGLEPGFSGTDLISSQSCALIWPRCAEVTFLRCCDYRLFPQAKPRAGAQHHQVSEAHQVTLDLKFVNVFVLSLCLYVNCILYSYI